MTREPERTALYRCYDREDLLLYIGVSKDFGARWKSEASEFSWWPTVRRQTVYWYDSRREAEAVEEAAIKAERPKHNKRHATRRSPEYTLEKLPLLLTYEQAAKVFDISVSKLYQLMREGKVRHVKLGPQVRRIPASECAAYLARKKAEQVGATPGVAA